jgi:hypothetical protein
MSRQSANSRARTLAPPPPNDWNRDDYRPGPDTPRRTCGRCGACYLDDEPSRAAHVVVFGHSPRPAEPAKPPQETTPS